MKLAARAMVVAGFSTVTALGVCACAGRGDANGASSDTGAALADSARASASSGKADSVAAAASQGLAHPGVPAGAAAQGAPPGVSVRTGVYTAAQAAHGQEVYSTSCAQCHTATQHSGSAFAAAWNNRRLADLYEIIHTTMPLDNPGGLGEQEYIDVVAYMLQMNGVPAGTSALQADPSALKGLRIDVKSSADQ